MIISNLLTKYILASFWMRILIFLVFYFTIRQLHFIDSDISIVECMPRKWKAKVIIETKEEATQTIPLVAESKDQTISQLEKQIKELTFERTGLREHISKLSQEKAQAEQINRLEVIQNLESIDFPKASPIITTPVEAQNINDLIKPLEEENARLLSRLQMTLERNRHLQDQLAESKMSSNLSYEEYKIRAKEERRLQIMEEQQLIKQNIQTLLLGHTIEEVFAYRRENVYPATIFNQILNNLNFFSFTSGPLEDYFYKIHAQHPDASCARIEEISRSYGNRPYGNIFQSKKSYIFDVEFWTFKQNVEQYEKNIWTLIDEYNQYTNVY